MGSDVLTGELVAGSSYSKQLVRASSAGNRTERKEGVDTRQRLPTATPTPPGRRQLVLPPSGCNRPLWHLNMACLPTALWNSQRCTLVVFECEDSSVMRTRIVTRLTRRSKRALYPGGGLPAGDPDRGQGSCPGAPRRVSPPPSFLCPSLHSFKVLLLNSRICLSVFLGVYLSSENVRPCLWPVGSPRTRVNTQHTSCSRKVCM